MISSLQLCVILSALSAVSAFAPVPSKGFVLKPLRQSGAMCWTLFGNMMICRKYLTGRKFIDEDAMLAASVFPIKPDDIIRLTKRALVKGVGTEDPSILADNFEFW